MVLVDDTAPDDESPTVMVVDDDPAIRAVLSRLLQRQGLAVVAFASGSAALEAVGTVAPDLILLDVLMPDIGGLELCRRLKSVPETRLLPIVLITGLDDRDARVAGINAGADDFLSKPFDHAELVARVHSLLRVKRYTDELERAESVLLALAITVEERDPYTRGHCDRLAAMSAELGRRLGLGPARVRDLERGGYLHDIGKVSVPDAVLNKRGPLTDSEWAQMRSHPESGERICSHLRSLQSVLPIIRHHHERLDGSGYPDGLAGDEIPHTARILQIVDVYDALTTERPYKDAVSPAAALAILEEEVRKGWWDPDIFAEFARMIREREGDGPRLSTDTGP